MDARQGQITSLLAAVRNGNSAAREELWHTVYAELHQIAQARLSREVRHPDLQTTVLVQEAYLRLAGSNGTVLPEDRRQLHAFAANAMRQFLIDHARKRRALKRGGGRVALGAMEAVEAPGDPADILAVDEVLEQLRRNDPRKAEIVQLRFYGGLQIDEIAEIVGLSPRTVDNEWRFARAWIFGQLAEEAPAAGRADRQVK
ncbi:MAG: sigma-70 family RNA polymerase sigma factor [Phycisphaerales bacterium]|nr:sigma-70 family RNA polymerase sigma factor [Phycisphaerales bacterium]